jgi:hypothetical protein
MAIGDVNGDHLDDVYIGHAMHSLPGLFIQQHDGSFQLKKVPAFLPDSASEDTDALFFDADSDGDKDLYVCSGGNEVPTSSSLLADRLYINTGKGDFVRSQQILPTFNFESTSCVKAGDYDQDGDMDLFVGVRLVPFNYGVPCNGYILNNQNGIFKPILVPELNKIGMITDAVWTDIDGDKDVDLVVVGEWMPVTILINDHGNFQNATSTYALSGSKGLWQSIGASDIDLDGDIDLIGGNWGLNSRIKSTPGKPINLYVNDFDQNGTAEQLITAFNGEKSYPLTLRQDLVAQMPYLKKKYLRFDSYKSQTMDDIFTPEQIKSSIKSECMTNATTLYIQQDGKFTARTLPFESQFSPVFSILVKDLNKDQLPDIILGGNFSASKPEIGGCMANPLTVLIQQQNHGYISSPINTTSTEVRAIHLIHIGQSSYILIANNNGALEVLDGEVHSSLAVSK